MKMTMHIDEDVLAQVMELTGAKTKTQAVEMALTEMARRHRQKKFFQKGLGLTPEQLGEYGRALMEIHGDSMDIDEAAVRPTLTLVLKATGTTFARPAPTRAKPKIATGTLGKAIAR